MQVGKIAGLGTAALLGVAAVRYRHGLRQAWTNRHLARERWGTLKPIALSNGTALRSAFASASWGERGSMLKNSAATTKTLAVSLFAPADG